MNVKYETTNPNALIFLGAWYNDLKSLTDELVMVDNDTEDLNVTFKFSMYNNTLQVELQYISACGCWYVDLYTSYNEQVANKLPLNNDKNFFPTLKMLLEQLMY